MDGGDIIAAVGVGVTFAMSASALVVAVRGERRRQRERVEDRATAKLEREEDRARAEMAVAQRALASLEAFAINYGAPAKEELGRGDLDGYLANFRSAREVVLSNLQLLKFGTLNPKLPDHANDAIGTIAKLSMDVEGAIQTRRSLLELARHGERLPAGEPSPETDFWLSAGKYSERLLHLHSQIRAAVAPTS